MAKRQKSRIKTRTVYKKAKRYAKRTTKGNALIQGDSLIYGGARRYLSQGVSMLTKNFPMLNVAGNLVANAVLGTGMYFLAKKSKGIIRNIAIKGLIAENVLAGDDIGSMLLGNVSTNVTENNGGW